MSTAFIDIVLEGDKFSPKKLVQITGLPIVSLAEYGDIASRGRFKGMKSPYGLAILKVGSSTLESLNEVLFNAINYLLKEKAALKQSGVEEIAMDLEDYNGNFLKTDKGILSKINDLNAALKEPNSNLVNEEMQDIYSDKIVYFLDADILQEFYASLLSNNTFLKGLTKEREQKLKYIFTNVLQYKLHNVTLTQSELLFAVFLYMAKYMETDFEDIPAFEKVLREKQLF